MTHVRKPPPDGARDWRKAYTPTEQLRKMLTVSKRAGTAWERAWPSAIERVLWPHTKPERQVEKSIVEDEAVRETWRRAYLDEPDERAELLARLDVEMLPEAPVDRTTPGRRVLALTSEQRATIRAA